MSARRLPSQRREEEGSQIDIGAESASEALRQTDVQNGKVN